MTTSTTHPTTTATATTIATAYNPLCDLQAGALCQLGRLFQRFPPVLNVVQDVTVDVGDGFPVHEFGNGSVAGDDGVDAGDGVVDVDDGPLGGVDNAGRRPEVG